MSLACNSLVYLPFFYNVRVNTRCLPSLQRRRLKRLDQQALAEGDEAVARGGPLELAAAIEVHLELLFQAPIVGLDGMPFAARLFVLREER